MILLFIITGFWVIGLMQILFSEDRSDIVLVSIALFLVITHLALILIVWSQKKKLQAIRKWHSKFPNTLDNFDRLHHTSPFDIPISQSTKCYQFTAITSVIIVTSNVSIFATGKSVFLIKILATIWTLLFGWWALPFGPIETIKAISNNLRNKENENLGDIDKWGDYWLGNEPD